MNLKLRALGIWTILLAPLAGALAGCSQGDNPQVASAPAPPPPKPENQVAKTRSGKTVDFGANPKYKEMMEKQGKYLGNPQ
jgi:hypothetical protein